MAEDHLVVAQGIQKLLRGHAHQVDVVATGEKLLEVIGELAPDLVLMDIGLPGISGIEALRTLRTEGIEIPVLMLTMQDDVAVVRKALALGASGYVLKQDSSEELLIAIEYAMRGQIFVSPSIQFQNACSRHAPRAFPSSAQMAVLKLAAKGMKAKQIAIELGVSRRTVESHKYAMMQHLGFTNAIQLITWAESEGIV